MLMKKIGVPEFEPNICGDIQKTPSNSAINRMQTLFAILRFFNAKFMTTSSSRMRLENKNSRSNASWERSNLLVEVSPSSKIATEKCVKRQQLKTPDLVSMPRERHKKAKAPFEEDRPQGYAPWSDAKKVKELLVEEQRA